MTKSFVCTRTLNGRPYGITIDGQSAEQIVRDYAEVLPGLKVEGELLATEDWPDMPERMMEVCDG